MTAANPSRILLIDDDPIVIHALSRILAPEVAPHGQLSFALSGAEGLALATAAPPDLVLLDAGLPDQTGFEVFRRLLGTPATAGVPVIFVTADDSPATEAAALALGARDYITKPIVEMQVRAQLRLRQALAGTAERAEQRPTPRPPATWQPPPLPPPLGAPGGRPHILIVDDELDAIEAMHHALAGLPARLQFAFNRADALRLAAIDPPDLVLLDLALPDGDGLSLCRQWQADPQMRHCAVVFVTQHTDTAREAQALEAGGIDFLRKPFSPALLQARVSNLLRLRRTGTLATTPINPGAGAAPHAAEADPGPADAPARPPAFPPWAPSTLDTVPLAQVLSAVSEAIIVVDRGGRVRLFNEAASLMLGQAPEDVLAHDCADALPALAGLRGQGARWPARQRLALARSGQPPLSLEVSTTTVGDGPQQVDVLVLRDLSERDRALAAETARLAAERVVRSKSLMMAFLAHEIGNPLHAILGMASLIEHDRDAPLPPPHRRRLQQLASAAQHLATLLRDVRDLHQMESPQFRIATAPVSAAQVLREAMDQVGPAVAQARVVLQLSPPPEHALVLADAGRLRQCLLNLLSNAIKYNHPGGSVRVQIKMLGVRVAFEVADDGLGMSPEQLAQLFEPFNRLGREHLAPGAGIGLLLTRQLVLAMGGQLEVHSQPGQGSRFTLSLAAA